MKKLGANDPLPEVDCQTMTNIVNTHFPNHWQRVYGDLITFSAVNPPLFTIVELQKAARSLKSNNAPELDGVPPEVLKLISKESFMVLFNMYNVCLIRSVFPISWKR